MYTLRFICFMDISENYTFLQDIFGTYLHYVRVSNEYVYNGTRIKHTSMSYTMVHDKCSHKYNIVELARQRIAFGLVCL